MKKILCITLSMLFIIGASVFAIDKSMLSDRHAQLLVDLIEQGVEIIESDGVENPAYLSDIVPMAWPVPPTSSIFIPSQAATMDFDYTSTGQTLYSDYLFVQDTASTPLRISLSTASSLTGNYQVQVKEKPTNAVIYNQTLAISQYNPPPVVIPSTYLNTSRSYYLEIKYVSGTSTHLSVFVY